MKKLIIRILLLLAGLTVAHLGVTLFLQANLGADPFNVFIQGIYRKVMAVTGWQRWTHGYTHMTISLIIIAVLLFVDKSYIRIGTVICMACGGPIIDFFTAVLGGVINDGNPFAVRILTLGAGCIILAAGMTLVMKSEAGVGPNDLVAIVVSDKLGKPFGRVRIIVDVTFVLGGWLLGGAVGIGTIICACLVGPVAGRLLPYSGKLVERVMITFIE